MNRETVYKIKEIHHYSKEEALSLGLEEDTTIYKMSDELLVIVSIHNDKYHLSISHNFRDPTYYEIKYARYKLIPDNRTMAMIYPPSKEFVNLHNHCFHLYEIEMDHFEQRGEKNG